MDDGRKKAEFCSVHAEPGTVDIKSKRFARQGCDKQPRYGVDDGSRNAYFCSQHAKAGMVDVVQTRCAHQGLNKIPSYGEDDGRKKVEFLKQHVKDGMLSKRKWGRTSPSAGGAAANTPGSSVPAALRLPDTKRKKRTVPDTRNVITFL